MALKPTSCSFLLQRVLQEEGYQGSDLGQVTGPVRALVSSLVKKAGGLAGPCEAMEVMGRRYRGKRRYFLLPPTLWAPLTQAPLSLFQLLPFISQLR